MKPFLHVLTGLIIALSIVGHSSNADAKRLKKLNESAIRDFISTTNKITSGAAQFRNDKQIEGYLNRHISDDAQFVSTMRFIIPGFPAEENLMNLGKEEFMSSVKQGSQDVEKYQNDIDILSIEFSEDSKRATVKTQSTERGLMAAGAEQIEIEGSSECTQLLGLSKRGHIQMQNAACMTEIKFVGN